MSIILCPECGKTLSTEAKICPHCGYRLKKQQNKDSKQKSYLHKTKFKVLLFICIIVILLIGGTLLYLSPLIKMKPEMNIEVETVNHGVSNITSTICLVDYKNISDLKNKYDDLSLKQKLYIKDKNKLEESYKKVVELKIKFAVDKINAIGAIDESSGQSIINAEKAYNDLNDYEKSRVHNYKNLQLKKKEYNSIIVKKLVDKIDKIESIDYSTINLLEEAEKDYESLDEDSKKNVTNYKKIINLRSDYDNNSIERIALIIGNAKNVKLKDKQSIKEARKLYDSLSEKGKKSCTYLKQLEKAEEEIHQLEIEEEKNKKKENKDKAKAQLKSSFYSKKDEVQKLTWYYPNDFPRYADIRSYTLPYLYIRDNSITVCARYLFTGNKWVFWKKIIFSVDGETQEKDVNYYDIVHDNYTEVWEYYDEEVSQTEIDLFRKIANSKKTIVRFQGDDYYEDFVVSANDKQAIKNVLKVYDLWNS